MGLGSWLGQALGAAVAAYGFAIKNIDVVMDGAGMVGSATATGKQLEGVDKALDVQRETYQQTRRDLQPFRETGGQAMTTMGAMMGLGGGGGAAAESPPPLVKANRRQMALPHQPAAERPTSPAPPSPDPMSTAASGYGGTVRMQAPNGEVGEIPAQFVEELERQGARRI